MGGGCRHQNVYKRVCDDCDRNWRFHDAAALAANGHNGIPTSLPGTARSPVRRYPLTWLSCAWGVMVLCSAMMM